MPVPVNGAPRACQAMGQGSGLAGSGPVASPSRTGLRLCPEPLTVLGRQSPKEPSDQRREPPSPSPAGPRLEVIRVVLGGGRVPSSQHIPGPAATPPLGPSLPSRAAPLP